MTINEKYKSKGRLNPWMKRVENLEEEKRIVINIKLIIK
jgi:uncharacterized protein (UPF0335 family)